jgi:hypothetical protein
LFQDLIDVKLNKEEENNDANLARGRRNRPIRTSTSGSEPKKKTVRKEDEDLDFEPESDHESESDDEKGWLLSFTLPPFIVPRLSCRFESFTELLSQRSQT